MNKNNIIIVTGLTGVGKDYLIEKVVHKTGIKIVGWGDLLSSELGINKDIMMEISSAKRISDAQMKVCHKIIAHQPILAICHVVKPEANGYTYNLVIERLLNPILYVFITAPPGIIYQRVDERNKSGKRKSTLHTIEEINEKQNIELAAVRKLSAIQNSEILVLNNVEEDLADNINELTKRIQLLQERYYLSNDKQ